ncbi:MAG TPA: hypothetical protein VEL07_03940 [Planctomycetota bacterium]|nr:hypothetical protein [Planctomycetota bacterium]
MDQIYFWAAIALIFASTLIWAWWHRARHPAQPIEGHEPPRDPRESGGG